MIVVAGTTGVIVGIGMIVVAGTTGVTVGTLFEVLVHPEDKITIIQIKIRKKFICFISILLNRR
jgi:hypothetical protein